MKKAIIAAVASCVLATPALAVTHTVNQVGFTFVPANLTIAPGDTVQWVWANGIHTVTSGPPTCVADGLFTMPFDAGNPTPSQLFPTAGVVPYFCIPHCGLNMVGTINVVAPVPTVSEWGMITFALLTLTGGTLVIRKAVARQHATA